MKKLFIIMIVAAMAVGACGGKKAAPAQPPAGGSDMTAPAAGSGDMKPAEGGGETPPPSK